MTFLRSAFSKFFKAGFLIATLLLAGAFYLAYQKIQLLSVAADQVNHTQAVRLELSQIIAQVQEVTTMQRRFLLTNDSTFLLALMRSQTTLFFRLQRLDSLTQDNAAQQRNLDSLRQLVQANFSFLQKVNLADIINKTSTWTKNMANMDSIQAQAQRMDQIEVKLLARWEMNRDESLRIAPFFALLLLFIALAIVAFSYLRIRNDLRNSRRELEIKVENTKKIVQLNETLQQAERISQTGNWQMDLNTGQRQYSDNIYRLFGHEPGAFEPSLEYWLPNVHTEDQAVVRNFGESAMLTKSDPVSITFRYLRPDGQLRHIYASGKIITTAQGDATLIGTVQDVTESYQLRQQLEERTRFAEMLIESSVDMIAAYDKNLHYTVWNKRCEELLNLKKQDVLGKLVYEIFPTVQEQGVTTTLDRALAGESVHIPPQASVISDHYYESYALPLRDDVGEVTGVLTITHDITESYVLRRQLEERSQFAETIIDSSVDMIITYDRDLRVTAWNKKSEEVFRLTKQEVLGRHVQDVFPYIAGMEANLQTVLQGGTVQYDPHELPPYGIHANLYLLPLKDHAGQVTGVLSISHDVSDVVQAAARLAAVNQTLEAKNKELANTNAELASFSYVASHDLQEPLRKIQSFASRILTSEKDRLSEMGQDAFRRMQSAADRMQQLIEDLLTYSRTNTQAGEFVVTDLNTILQEAEQEVSEAIQEKQAVIEADPLPTARVIVFQFRQLVANLLSNALKYQHPGVVPHIRITCTMVLGEEVPQMDAAGKYYLQIKVIDNGIGFEQQYGERIFELFQRLHGRSEYKGTGIGLAICRKIMQNHQGYLLAEGRPGEGATFTIYLPV